MRPWWIFGLISYGIGGNQLTGTIPEELANLGNLSALNLGEFFRVL